MFGVAAQSQRITKVALKSVLCDSENLEFCFVCVLQNLQFEDWISGPSMAACGEVVSNLGKNELISPPTVIPALVFFQGFPFVRLLTCLGISKMCGHCFYLEMRKSGIWVASRHEEIAEGWTGSCEMLWGLGSAERCPLQLQSHPEKICRWEARSKGPQWESGRGSGAGPHDHGMWQTFWGEWKAPTVFLPYSSWNSIRQLEWLLHLWLISEFFFFLTMVHWIVPPRNMRRQPQSWGFDS